VRQIALSLPETAEKPTYGTPGFRVKDRLFLRIRSEGEDGLVVGPRCLTNDASLPQTHTICRKRGS